MKVPLLPLKRFVDPTRPITYGIVQAGENYPDGVPYIRPVDMTDHDGVADVAGLLRTAPSTAQAYKRSEIQEGDIVISIGPSYGKTMLVGEDLTGANLTQGTARVAVNRGHDSRYIRWALRSAVASASWDAAVGGATFRALNLEPLGETPIPLWPHQIQRTIADYLDRETAGIDALIAAKRQLVELLEERRRELVTNLLLGPPIVGGQSGAGQVTLHPGWRLAPFRRLFREIDIRSETGAENLLSVSQTRGVILQSELGDRRQYAETLVGYKKCQPGDLVINRMWVYYGALGVARQVGLVSPDYAVFRPIAEMSSPFAAYILRTDAYIGEMTRLVRGIGAAFQGTVRKPRLHPNELGLIEMPVPTQSDQQALLDLLDERIRAITCRVSLIIRSITLLQERHQALITAAVTGQLGIPEAE